VWDINTPLTYANLLRKKNIFYWLKSSLREQDEKSKRLKKKKKREGRCGNGIDITDRIRAIRALDPIQ
jgi:hypothetical protein